MALKPIKNSPTTELRPRLTIQQSSLDYAKAYAEQSGRTLDQVLSQALDQVLKPGKKKVNN